MNLNADLGEGAGADEEILPQIDSANIACGVYAGSVSITIATAQLCRQLKVEIGAHPPLMLWRASPRPTVSA